MLRKYIIERDVPGIGNNTTEGYCAISQQSKDVLDGLGTQVQWIESYVAADKTYCVYLATDVDFIEEHARRSGFPATRIEAVKAVIDPTMAPA